MSDRFKIHNKKAVYLRRDVQGTITGLVNQNDSIVEEYSYDACLSRCSREGRRRNPTDWTYDSVPQPQYLYRGYTMHVLRNTDCGSVANRNPNVEQIPILYHFYYFGVDYIGKMLDEFGLINMPARRNGNEGGNGRCGVYPDEIGNPVVGRFLSPDIIVQNPNNTQCYNRYSYCINNPLKYSDPSGWSYGTLAQMHDNAQRAAWQEMQARNRQLWQEFNSRMSNPKQARMLALGLQGKNGLSGTADGTFFSDIQSIASTLHILGLSGIFGNPGDPPASLSKNTSQTIPSYGVDIVNKVMNEAIALPPSSSQGNCMLVVNQSNYCNTSGLSNNTGAQPTISMKLTSYTIPGNLISIETYTKGVVQGDESVTINLDVNQQYESITLKNSMGDFTIGNDLLIVGKNYLSLGVDQENYILDISIPYGVSAYGGVTLYFNKSRTQEFIGYGFMVAKIVYPPFRFVPVY